MTRFCLKYLYVTLIGTAYLCSLFRGRNSTFDCSVVKCFISSKYWQNSTHSYFQSSGCIYISLMDALHKNHLAVIKAQSSILFKEVRRSRTDSQAPISDLPLPLSLQKRCDSASNFHNTRIIDNFEVTILYLLDQDGLVQETNRLGRQHCHTYTLLIMCLIYSCASCISRNIHDPYGQYPGGLCGSASAVLVPAAPQRVGCHEGKG